MGNRGVTRAAATPGELGAPALADLLRGLLAGFVQASGAQIATLYLYNQETHEFYAPFAVGVSEDRLGDSLSDMRDQVARYLSDEAAGKAPADLGFGTYGSNVWLTATRRTLLARDARTELDSSFVRRHQVAAVIGLPLLSGSTLHGLVYLNFQDAAQLPDAKRLVGLERRAAEGAAAVASFLARADREALATAGILTRDLGAATGSAFNRNITEALTHLRTALSVEAVAVYQLKEDGRLGLVAGEGLDALPGSVAVPPEPAEWEAPLLAATRSAARDLRLVASLELNAAEPQGQLIAFSRDPLAIRRLAPATVALLRTAADLLASALAAQRLVARLEDTNRVLGALSRMSNAMLRPGSTRQQVLSALVRHLTDREIPEFHFDIASVFLLEDVGEGNLGVRLAVGSEPLEQVRDLAGDDVLAFAARGWHVVAVGSVGGAEVLAGYSEEQLLAVPVPVRKADGSTIAQVTAWLVEPSGGVPDPPFSLAGEVFEERAHHDVNRVFIPFGMDTRGRASGVLELGYATSRRRTLQRTQVEALRAAASLVAVAVETARLYEDVSFHAEQLELSSDVSKAIASSIDLDQTLRLVARNLVRLVSASVCQIALYEEDGSGWYGAAASSDEEAWRRQRGERPERSFLFEVLDRREPLVIDDAPASDLVDDVYSKLFKVRSLLAVPLIADGHPIGAAVLAQVGEARSFTENEVELAQGLAHQAAVAIKNARLHAFAEEERHIEKDFVLVGFGQWGQKAYQHLLTLKQFFNFKTHVVQLDTPGARATLSGRVEEVLAHGDAFYWDAEGNPAHEQLETELEASSYVVTYIATPAATHLPTLARYYDLSDVIVIEKPLGASPEEYRKFLDSAPGRVQIVAADHYYFKLEVRLLQLLLTEERTLRAFLDTVEEIRVEILEEQPLTGAAAEIGVIADLIPHAFAIVSLFTPIDRIRLDAETPLRIGRHEPLQGSRETFARMTGTLTHQGRPVRLVIEMGKGVENSKWIKLSSEGRLTGRRPFYKFDFGRGEAIDGTQASVHAARRNIRQPGVLDNAHLTMLRHVIEKQRPAVGILSIREALRSNQRIQELDAMAAELLARGEWTPYPIGRRPDFSAARVPG